jgi:3-(methylthio)propionyl---CoA ligase
MRGLMMERPLLISSILDYAARYHGATEMVARTGDGALHRTDYARLRGRARRLAAALQERLGVRAGDRVATLAWNDHRHFELYYAISGLGAVCHTVNPRLFADQIVYIINHARDRWLFCDPMFLPLLDSLRPRLASLEGVVVLADEAPEGLLAYESLLAGAELEWPLLDETAACGLCYTSGTTGNPKGTLYSHRAVVLHTLAALGADAIAITARDTVLPAVPMFHVNAWGLPYACTMAGARMVMPGPRLDGASLFELLEREGVTLTAGVPTIWFNLLGHLRETGQRFTSLKRLLVGGSAAPRAMIETFERDYGVEVIHAWGMTETTPLGVIGTLKRGMEGLPPERRWDVKVKQGHAIWGVELKIVDDDGNPLPHDGRSAGLLHVRGPWVASAYFEDEAASAAAFDGEGWFATGDVATIDPDGFMHLTDRAKDIIRSGGEWISSIDLENAAVGHPDLLEAAAIAIPHPKWGERPLLVAVKRQGASLDSDEVIAFLRDKVASWWLPDEVVFVDELPHTATGKVQKTALRERFKDYRLPSSSS